ncbi:Nitrogen fixation protein of unknown function [Synechococcus sp. MIT S9509]|uniref:Nif11-like leader peptide family natural product precursor n=1 Tax=unclassified Synechococcus TaxID=2626047 RepID=UPI0007BC776B|nr:MULTISPECIES: Nif11-like leader peptide family natural product precursor [unclassified Synechococcus]KZR88089.1 Nitrogen fixation protein of unknown function [Synechococcus sp. MIT S9504]KZR92126.1 Nitrogen fixation protein of unknown function [Synechococcus sp. MIT S9509]
MSLEQLKAFLAKVKGDSSLQQKLKAAKTPDEVVSIAEEHGHEFTADKISQLSEEELEVVLGGALQSTIQSENCTFRGANCQL